jgi:hypothetical protein
MMRLRNTGTDRIEKIYRMTKDGHSGRRCTGWAGEGDSECVERCIWQGKIARDEKGKDSGKDELDGTRWTGQGKDGQDKVDKAGERWIGRVKTDIHRKGWLAKVEEDKKGTCWWIGQKGPRQVKDRQ